MKCRQGIRRFSAWGFSALAVYLMPTVPAVSGEVVGQTRSRLDTLNADKQGTSFCDLTADAFRATGKADIALINASAFAPGSINPGGVTVDQVEALFQFPDDRLVVADVSGDTLQRMMERSVGVYPTPNDGFLHVSGLKVVFDPNRAPGERILSIKVLEGTREVPLNGSHTYRVATSRTLARGGLGYFKIVGPNLQIQRLNETASESVITYIQSAGTVNYGNEKRVTTK